jgi:hypothetical protein
MSPKKSDSAGGCNRLAFTADQNDPTFPNRFAAAAAENFLTAVERVMAVTRRIHSSNP